MAREFPMVVRFRDLDAMGHVNNAVVFTYMEQARSEYFFQLTGERRLTSLGFIVARAECNYEAPISMGDEVVVRLWPSHIGGSSFTFDYEIVEGRSHHRLATGRTVLVRYDYTAGSKVPVEETFRRTLEKELGKPGDW